MNIKRIVYGVVNIPIILLTMIGGALVGLGMLLYYMKKGLTAQEASQEVNAYAKNVTTNFRIPFYLETVFSIIIWVALFVWLF